MQACKPSPSSKLIATAVLAAGLALTGPAHATPPMFGDETATYSGQKLLEQTARKPDVEIKGLEASGRSAITADLTEARRVLADDAKTFGKAKSVRLFEASHFGPCVTARYRVDYSNGSRYWLLHFRHGSKGLQLDTVTALDS
jgi:hypothetical protein